MSYFVGYAMFELGKVVLHHGSYVIMIAVFITLSMNSTLCAYGTITKIPEDVEKEMKKYTWDESCPVPLKYLRYLSIQYRGFDGKDHVGHLIVHVDLADDVLSVFQYLHKKYRFPIERMEPMYIFKGVDADALSSNNTSAFNCKGDTSAFGQHSQGIAIDINPKINPYVKNGEVFPSGSEKYLSGSALYQGKIKKDSHVYHTFINRGWRWGGDFHSSKDYHHFEKQIDGLEYKGTED